MNSSRMYELVSALAEAKNRQDVAAALNFMHPDMELETPAFGSVVRGTQENERALTRFFRAFPDYQATLESYAANGRELVAWGMVRMTMTGTGFGVTPNGKRAELPVFILFTFRDGLIASERFCFDLVALCAQSGVSTDVVQRALSGTRSPQTTGVSSAAD